jgi:hypothetical protein
MLSQSSGAGRGTTDAEDATRNDAPGARDAPVTRDAPGAHDQQPERRRQAAPSVADAPGAQGQQPGGSKTVKDKNAPGARPKTVKDKTRDKNVSPGRTYPACELLMLPNPPSPRFEAKHGFVGIANALAT